MRATDGNNNSAFITTYLPLIANVLNVAYVL